MLNKCGTSLFHTCFTKLFAVKVVTFFSCMYGGALSRHLVLVFVWNSGSLEGGFFMIRDLGEWWGWQRVNSTGEKK